MKFASIPCLAPNLRRNRKEYLWTRLELVLCLISELLRNGKVQSHFETCFSLAKLQVSRHNLTLSSKELGILKDLKMQVLRTSLQKLQHKLCIHISYHFSTHKSKKTDQLQSKEIRQSSVNCFLVSNSCLNFRQPRKIFRKPMRISNSKLSTMS